MKNVWTGNDVMESHISFAKLFYGLNWIRIEEMKKKLHGTGTHLVWK
jgi:hypothetical protein